MIMVGQLLIVSYIQERKLSLMIVRECPWRARQLQQFWRPLGFRGLHRERAIREDKRWPGWEVVVGIEVHAQIKSRRKLFSSQYEALSEYLANVSPYSTCRCIDFQAWGKTQLVRHLL